MERWFEEVEVAEKREDWGRGRWTVLDLGEKMMNQDVKKVEDEEI